MNKITNKMIFCIKQLLPLKYHSKYSIQSGERELAIWRQWFGKPFDIEHFRLVD